MAITERNQDPIKLYRSGQVSQVALCSPHTRPNRMPFRAEKIFKNILPRGPHLGADTLIPDAKSWCPGAVRALT